MQLALPLTSGMRLEESLRGLLVHYTDHTMAPGTVLCGQTVEPVPLVPYAANWWSAVTCSGCLSRRGEA